MDYQFKGFRQRDAEGETGVVVEEKPEEREEENQIIEGRLIIPETKFTMPKEEVVQHRTIPKDEAKRAILDLFEQKGELDYGDIMEALGLDLAVVVEVCRDLEEEGRIKALEE